MYEKSSALQVQVIQILVYFSAAAQTQITEPDGKSVLADKQKQAFVPPCRQDFTLDVRATTDRSVGACILCGGVWG